MVFVFFGLLIIGNNSLHMYKHDDVVSFVDLYLTWGNNVFSNFKNVAGDVVDMDWLPRNSS
jgi:hypothetical protein